MTLIVTTVSTPNMHLCGLASYEFSRSGRPFDRRRRSVLLALCRGSDRRLVSAGLAQTLGFLTVRKIIGREVQRVRLVVQAR